MTREELLELKLPHASAKAAELAQKHWDNVAKPLDGLGTFEKVLVKMAAVQDTENVHMDKPILMALCADNGIVAEGISQSGQEVTALVAKNLADKKSSASRMADSIGCQVWSVDMGINSDQEIEGVIPRKVMMGTRDFLVEPAMTEEEALKAIETGINLVKDAKEQGYDCIVTGEMGIGNTTTSAAMAACLLNEDVAMVTGVGAGLSQAGLVHKKEVIQQAVDKYNLRQADPLTLLRTVGGLDIAGLVGIFLGGSLYQVPVVIDGVITAVAALTATRLHPECKDVMLPSHAGREPALSKILAELGLEPLIGGSMALGEGSGGVMLLPLLQMVLQVYHSCNSFAGITMEAYERFED